MSRVEELTQETFYQAVRSIDRFDESCKITTWLCAIAKNQYFAYAKKHARLQVDPDVDLMSDGVGVTGNTVSAEQEVLQQIGQNEQVEKHLEELRKVCREQELRIEQLEKMLSEEKE